MPPAAPAPTPAKASSSSAPAAAQPKRKRTNVARACVNCRRRKTKCDGVHPECGTCKLYKDECAYGEDDDGRKPASRQYVEALRSRIKALEALLEARGISTSADSASGAAAAASGGVGAGPETDAGTGGEQDEADLSSRVGRLLMEDDTGDLRLYGPTSAFHHLPAPARTSPASLAPHSPASLASTSSSPPGFLPLHHLSPPPQPAAAQFEWNRHLPPDVPLDLAEHDLLLDRFFRYFSAWGERVEPHLFLRDMRIALTSSTPVRVQHYSPMLHNALLALASAYSSSPSISSPRTRIAFGQHAKRTLEQECERPALSTVQALALLSSYHSTRAEHGLGWLFMGMANRTAESLGLNVDCSPWVRSGDISERDMLERNTTFWTAYVQDKLWSIYVGRTAGISEYTTPPPRVDPETDALPWTWPGDSPGPDGEPPRNQPGMLSSVFVETVKLSLIAQRIMNVVYGLRSDLSALAKGNYVSEIGLQLDAWHEALPSKLVLSSHSTRNALPHVLMLHLAFSWLTILLFRPFYRALSPLPHHPSTSPNNSTTPSTPAAHAVKRCDRSASRIVSLLSTWRALFGLRFTPITITQIAFTAGTTHLLAAVQQSPAAAKRRKDALEGTRECVRCLREIGESWEGAMQKAGILEGLVEEWAGGLARQPSHQQQQQVKVEKNDGPDPLAAMPVAQGRPAPVPSPVVASSILGLSTSPARAKLSPSLPHPTPTTSVPLAAAPAPVPTPATPISVVPTPGPTGGLYAPPSASSPTASADGLDLSDPFVQSLLHQIAVPQQAAHAPAYAFSGPHAHVHPDNPLALLNAHPHAYAPPSANPNPTPGPNPNLYHPPVHQQPLIPPAHAYAYAPLGNGNGYAMPSSQQQQQHRGMFFLTDEQLQPAEDWATFLRLGGGAGAGGEGWGGGGTGAGAEAGGKGGGMH